MSLRPVIIAISFVFAFVFVASTAQAQQLNAPTNFDGTATGTSTIQWTWTDTNSSPNEVGHRVFDADSHVRISDPDAPADSTSWDEEFLTENTLANRYVKAIGSSGGGEVFDANYQPSTTTVQSYTVYSGQSLGQSFTAGTTGTLSRIYVLIGRTVGTTSSLLIEFYDDSGGLPGTLQSSVTRDDVPAVAGTVGWYEVTFPDNINITLGEQYWIALKCSSSTNDYRWSGLTPGGYPDGVCCLDQGFGWVIASSYDLYFAVYINAGAAALDSVASNSTAVYTLVHDPIDADYTITTTFGSLDVDIDVLPPPNSDQGLTAVQIRRGTDSGLSDGTVIKAFTDAGYTYTDTVPNTGTYYYGITFRNGDGVETAEHISSAIDVVGELPTPSNFTGTGTGETEITWEWLDDVDNADGYLLESDTGSIIAVLDKPAAEYIETVSGENTPATRQLRSVVYGTTTLAVEPTITGGQIWPWTTQGRHMQMLYLASELSNTPGKITKIYWRLNSETLASNTFNNVVVKLGHTTLSALGATFADNFTEGDATEVYNSATYTVPASATGTWIEIPISDGFYYNGTNNVVVDIELTGGTDNVSWSGNSSDYSNGVSLYAGPGPSFPTGEVWDYKYYIRFDVTTIESKSDPTPLVTAYSLVHDATTGDFSLALDGTQTEVIVTVTPPANQDSGLTGVKIERATDDAFTTDLTTVQDFTNNYTFNDTAVTQGITYHYRITFCNGDGVESGTSTGQEITVPGVVDTPTAVITAPSGGIYSGDVTISYDLSDPQGDTCSIFVEYSLNSGADWTTCTQGTGGDAISGLTTNATGISYTYVWDTVADAVGDPQEAVMVRITPSDTAEGQSDTTGFTVNNAAGNQPPVAEITDPLSGTYSDDITITYTLSDADSDTCSIAAEWSLDGVSWNGCTMGSGGDGTTPLSSSPGGISHTYVWDSVTDGVGTSTVQAVHLRITPSDSTAGTSDTTNFDVDNVPQNPPTAAVTDPTGGTYFGNVTITYTLTDINSDTCSITVEYSDNAGGNWYSCTQGTGGDGTSGLSSSPGGETHTYVWNTVADAVGTVTPDNVIVRITPDDGAAGTPGTSSQFTVDNTGPEPLNADFTGSPVSGPAALNVNFTDTSTGNIDSWIWNFGDGGTSAEQNPSHTYNLVGTYTVTLTVDGPDGQDTETKVDYITVTDPGTLTADFSATPTSGAAPLSVDFTDLSVGNVTSWEWDFNNDGFVDATQQNPSYTYNNSGVYTVSLTVSGPSLSDTETKTGYISVSAAAAPVADDDDGGGCSCSVDRSATPVSSLVGYFLPVMLMACAYLALRRKNS